MCSRSSSENDWLTEIQDLKKNLLGEVRKNHVLEKEVSKLDKRIALLIKNRGNIEELFKPNTKKGKGNEVVKSSDNITEPKKLEVNILFF